MTLLIALLLFVLLETAAETCDWARQTTSYSQPCAEQAARYSSVAYDTNRTSIYEWQCTSCMHSQELFVLDILNGRKGDCYGYIGYQIASPEILVLSFRGTIWLDGDSAVADLSFSETEWPSSVPNSTVDHGFLEYFLKVRPRIRDIIAARLLQIPDTKLVITGHSLGGAAAIIAAVDLYDVIQDLIVYTFGSPRVGNSFFAQYLKKLDLRIFRVNHDHDLVPHLPPCTFLLWDRSCKGGRYPTHAPREILYDKQMKSFIECSNTDGEDRNCSDAFIPVSYSIVEHLTYFGYNLASPGHFLLHSALNDQTILI